MCGCRPAGRGSGITRYYETAVKSLISPESPTFDGVDLYVFGARETAQRMSLFARRINRTEATIKHEKRRARARVWMRGVDGRGGRWFVYRAARMAIYLTDKADRRYSLAPLPSLPPLVDINGPASPGAEVFGDFVGRNGERWSLSRTASRTLEYTFNFSRINGP